MSTNSSKATLVAMTAFFLWGFSFMFSRMGLNVARPYVMLAHRFSLAAVCMGLMMRLGKMKLSFRGKPVGKLLLMGLCDPVIYFTGETFGILYSSTAFSGVMIATIPIFTLIAGRMFLHEATTKSQVFWSILSVAGVMVIAMQGSRDGAVTLPGVLFLLMAVVASTTYTALGRALASEFSPYERNLICMVEGSVAFWLMAIIQCRDDFSQLITPLADQDYRIAILVLAVMASVVCYTALNYALSYLSINRVNIGSNLVTVVSIFAGVVFLHEPFSWLSVLCSVVIVVGIYGVQKTAAPTEEIHGE